MSFFRRRDRNQFKHIAHGLIPAATVAPRSAVPRTPPPRSPNPSPERPRSALAAAILMTSLTGRTVAMPQPRQRSYSENDSSYAQEVSIIEPYATARELGLAQNWKEYVDGKTVSTPVTSFEFEGEETDQQMSDLEREHGLQISERTSRSPSNEPIYALPNKQKKKQTQPVREEDNKASEISSTEANVEMVPELLAVARQEEWKVDGPAPSPIPHSDRRTGHKSPRRKKPTEVIQSDVLDHFNVNSPAVGTEEPVQLRAHNQQLTNENLELTNRVEEMRQQMKAMRAKIKDLKNERQSLTGAVKMQHTEADAAELISLREQAQELVDENDALKMTVHRLNVELGRYQTKYRPLTKEEKGKMGGLPQRGPPPPWLIDMKYLSPLLLAYEDRMREKDNLIQAFEEEMINIKVRIQKVIAENEELHKQLTEDRPVTAKEWELMQSQTKLVLEENQVLMEQLEVQEAKERDSYSQHLQEVSRLTKQVMVLEAKNQSEADELREMEKQQDMLRSKYTELKTNMADRIHAEEHVATVTDLKSQLQRERERSKSEVQELMGKLSILQAQKKSLLLERNDLSADNKILEAEVETVKKSNRKFQRMVGQLKSQLEDAMDKEVAAHQYLANLITLAETISGERDELIYMTRGLESEKKGALNKMVEDSIRLGRLEEMVKEYKRKAAGKLEGINHKLTEKEEDFAQKAIQYQREMRHLQRMLRDKHERLEQVLLQNRQVEGELEVIWESTSKENKQLKTLLYKSMKQTRSNASNFSPIFQPDSAIEYGFSYCDVNASSHEEKPVK
ncbi:centrosomal protein of 89 kDa [Pelodytes ibericus]